MRSCGVRIRLLSVFCLVGCGGHAGPPAEPTSRAQPWAVPAGFRSETIPFPLEFAPDLVHRGLEELRFAPGFMDPGAPGYWSYTFAWRLEDAAALDAAGVGAELTAYFRGLIDAVDEHHDIAPRDAIVARAVPEVVGQDAGRFQLAVHVFDAFKTKQPIDLTGWADRIPCNGGAVWRFVLAPASSGVRPALDALAVQVACEQPALPPPAK